MCCDPTWITKLGALYPDTGLLGKPVMVYLAQTPLPPKMGGDTGRAPISLASVGDVIDLIAAGQLDDGITLAALMLFLARRQKGEGRQT